MCMFGMCLIVLDDSCKNKVYDSRNHSIEAGIELSPVEVIESDTDDNIDLVAESDILSATDPIFSDVYRENDKVISADNGETYNGSEFENNGKPYCIKINRKQNVVTIYILDENDMYTVPLKAMVCSVGDGIGDNVTPLGTFTTQDKQKWGLLYGDVWGQYTYRIDGPILFHSVPYYTKDKGDLETEEYNKLGMAASQGCIRLAVIDAKWIYDNCKRGTIVEIFESNYLGPLGKPTFTPIDTSLEKDIMGWDPTDPDEGNPWLEYNLPAIVGANDRVIERTEDINLLSGVSVIGNDFESTTADLMIEGYVNTSKVGEYQITYTYSGGDALATKQVMVKVVDTICPEITKVPDVICVTHDEIASMDVKDILLRGVEAKDSGETLVKDSIIVGYRELVGQTEGTYEVPYIAVDAAGNYSKTKIIQIKIE